MQEARYSTHFKLLRFSYNIIYVWFVEIKVNCAGYILHVHFIYTSCRFVWFRLGGKPTEERERRVHA